MSAYNNDRERDKPSVNSMFEKRLEQNKIMIESKLKESADEAKTRTERFDFLKTAAEMRKVLFSADHH
jgi:hypothetical protein